CLEHIDHAPAAIRDWFRVLKVGGFLIILVPHQHLYERKVNPPSYWNADHRRFYTPACLMAEIEAALEPNTYRLRHLSDNDVGYSYSTPIDQHPSGSYEIELVVEKIVPPSWKLVGSIGSEPTRAFGAVPAALGPGVDKDILEPALPPRSPERPGT